MTERISERFAANGLSAWTTSRGRILAAFPRRPLLLYGGLSRGLGSSRLDLDRGKASEVRLVAWRHVDTDRPGALLLRLAHRRGAGIGADDEVFAAAEASAVDDSFAPSPIGFAPLVSDEDRRRLGIEPMETDGVRVLDCTWLVASDLLGIVEGASVRAKEIGARASIVSEAAAPVSASTRAETIPGGSGAIEFVADIGVAVEGLEEGEEAGSPVLVRQHVVFAEPRDGFERRRHRTGEGMVPVAAADPRRVFEGDADLLLSPSFRMDGRPIEFAVDRGVPSALSGAVLEGVDWWREGFERAGAVSRIRAVSASPEDMSWLPGRNAVWWVHRDGRGWSLGDAQSQPHTGEIIRGNVRLGGERFAQLRELFESLLAPYGDGREAELLEQIDHGLRSRARLLAAHEVGHALGFAHNFSSHLHEAPSVMDYPFPGLRFVGEDRVELAEEPYPTALGPWDHRLIRRAYGRPGEEGHEELAPAYSSDPDARPASSSTPRSVAWAPRVAGPGPAAGTLPALHRLLEVRRRALRRFGPGVAPPDAPRDVLRGRYARLYLLHRYAIPETVRLLGGIEYEHTDIARARPVRPVPAAEQRQALTALTALLTREFLLAPAPSHPLLSPHARGYGRSREEPAGAAGGPFDSMRLVEAAVSLVLRELFRPERLNRLAEAEALRTTAGEAPPTVVEVIHAAASAAGDFPPAAATVVESVAVAAEGAHAWVRRQLVEALEDWPVSRTASEARSTALALYGGASKRGVAWSEIPSGEPL